MDEEVAEAHISLAQVMSVYEWDWSAAEKHFKRAIELKPGYSLAHTWYGGYLAHLGRFAEAISEVKRARDLDPQSPTTAVFGGDAFYLARRYDEAIELHRKALEMDSDFFPAHWGLGWAYMEKRMYGEAISELQKTVKLSEGSALPSLAQAYAASGNRAEAYRLLNQLKSPPPGRFISQYEIAVVYVKLGDNDQGFEWMRKGLEDRVEGLADLKVDPRIDAMRSDPRFAEMLHLIRLLL